MKDLPIHVRLTAWYMVSLTVIITLFASASWYAMRTSMYHAIDNDLAYRMNAVIPFIESHALNTPGSFARTFANTSDSSIVGVFVQITDANSDVLYQSDVLASHKVAVLPFGSPNGSLKQSTVEHEGWTIRVATERISVNGLPLTVHVVEPLSDLLTSLHEISLRFMVLVSIALFGTACSGYWISRRALAPVEQIRREADAVDPADLTARLHVPAHDDELGKLVSTLTSMLTRIEEGFHHVERFTADASHELRTPLTFIITAGEVCLRRQRSREELADALNSIMIEARRMSRLVEDLLALARGDAFQHSSKREPVDLNALVSEVVSRMTPVAAGRGLLLDVSMPYKPVEICGVPSDFRRLADALNSIMIEARRMSRLVEDLLALARGDAFQHSSKREPVDLNALVSEVVSRMTPVAAGRGLLLDVSMPYKPVEICGVPSDFRRLLLILIDNSIKYTDAGRVTVDVRSGQDCVTIAVRDTGIGIEPSGLPHLFSRFWRADKVRSRAEGGVGLGLALAAQIAQRNQGSIAVESTFGAGSTFTVKLQRADAGQAEPRS